MSVYGRDRHMVELIGVNDDTVTYLYYLDGKIECGGMADRREFEIFLRFMRLTLMSSD